LKPAADPIAEIIIERVEEAIRYPDGTLSTATFSLHYKVVDSGDIFGRGHRQEGRFEARYSAFANSLSLTYPTLFLDLYGLEGNRIGTYLMSVLVEWARQWPDADLARIELVAGQASEDNRDRRNRFYERFGIEFDWNDPLRRTSGFSKPMKIAALRDVESWKENISEIPFWDFMKKRRFEYADMKLRADAECSRAESLYRDLRPFYDKPIRSGMRLIRRGIGWQLRALTLPALFLAMIVACVWRWA
jgi:GNAT superfamily N-acetyltransferase